MIDGELHQTKETNPIAIGLERAINELCDAKNKQKRLFPEELIYETESKKIFKFMQEIFQFTKVDKLTESSSDDYMESTYRENIKIARLRKRFEKICEKFLYKYIYIKTGKTKKDLYS